MLRAPICTILGHVDAGKTSLLDVLRESSIQKKEAGGITQKIGTTFMKKESIEEITKEINKEIAIPGIIYIDTPGHECFSAIRMCGLLISDIIIIVVDIFKGLEQQTIECINLLHEYKRPFIIATNKMDRFYGWKANTNQNFMCLKNTLKNQNKKTLSMLDDHIDKICSQALSYGFSSSLYYKNNDIKHNISIVPISAKTGEGIPDLIMLINVLSLQFMKKKLTVTNEINGGYIIEKIKDKKHGNILSSLLINGKIKSDDCIMLINENNNIIEFQLRQLYKPMDGMEVKDSINMSLMSEIDTQLPFIIKGNDDLNPKPGTPFYVINQDNRIKMIELLEKYKIKYLSDNKIKLVKYGVQINAKTYNSAQGLGELCNTKNIPVSKIMVGDINKINLMKLNIKYENINKTNDDLLFNKRYLVILAYDTVINDELIKLAESMNIKIIIHPIIYKLVEECENYIEKLDNELKNKYPNLRPQCELKIISKFIFHKKDPLIFGVIVTKNKLCIGMVLETIIKKDVIKVKSGQKSKVVEEIVFTLGKVTSIQKNNKQIDEAKENEPVCIKIEVLNENDHKYEYGRDFDDKNLIRSSINKTEQELLFKYPTIFK